uniref:Alpha carbonic anhydrase 8 n=1 Tax=Exaiptasia diaphana TaxID=2652724 RepID=A0A1B0YB38_EXADI|nr:alpha carbonic anhydrase 8 [Exaiptasia diaphana]
MKKLYVLNKVLYSLALVTIVNGISVPKPKGQPVWGYWECVTGIYCPSSWKSISKYCGGSRQSPIDISSYYMPTKPPRKPLQVESDNDDGLVIGVFANTGHTAQFTVEENKGSVYLSGGPADSETYKLSHIKFHFGCSITTGSEHTFDTNPSAAEMQMVFYNSKYKDFKEAANETDGLLIVSSLFTPYGGPTYYVNPTLERLVAMLPNITQPGSYVMLNNDARIELTKLVPELTRPYPYYFTYKGSLTTPPCYESVTWVVLKEKLTISMDQLEQFKSLKNRHGFSQCDNARPTQPVNNREITKNFNPY